MRAWDCSEQETALALAEAWSASVPAGAARIEWQVDTTNLEESQNGNGPHNVMLAVRGQ